MRSRTLRASQGYLAGVVVLALLGGLLGEAGAGGLSGFLAGARATVEVSLFVVIVSFAVAIAAGALAALGPATFDVILARIVEVTGALPSVVVVAVFASLAKTSSLPALGAVLALKRGFEAAKVARAELLQLSAEDFVVAARASGTTDFRLFRTHFFPFIAPEALSSALMGGAAVVAVDAAGSFIGIFPGGGTWGTALAEAVRRASLGSFFWPALGTALAVASLAVVSDSFAERSRVPRRFLY